MNHVVAISGGKDSVAMALRLREIYPDKRFIYVCTPTGNETSDVADHWNRLEELLGQKIERITGAFIDGKIAGWKEAAPGVDYLRELIYQQAMIPNFRARFCTRMLKIEPMLHWLRDHSPCVQYVGLRADEEEREGIYGTDVPQRYPLRQWGWGIKEVWSYLDSRGVEIPERTDCALCFFQKLIEWKRLYLYRRQCFDAGIKIEDDLGHTFRSPGRDTWAADLRSLGKEFEGGRRVRGEEKFLKRKLKDCDRESLCRVCTL